MIHAVLFDLGGTLIDNADPMGRAETAHRLGVEVDPDALARASRAVLSEFDRAGQGETREFWSSVFGRATGRALPPE